MPSELKNLGSEDFVFNLLVCGLGTTEEAKQIKKQQAKMKQGRRYG